MNRARWRIAYCPLMCDLSDISWFQGCKHWADHMYMVWRFALVVSPGINFCEPPGIFFGWGHPKIYYSAYGASCCSWCCTILRLLVSCCSISVLLHWLLIPWYYSQSNKTDQSSFIAISICVEPSQTGLIYLVFARHCWLLGLFISNGASHYSRNLANLTWKSYLKFL